MLMLRVLVFALGFALVVATLGSAIRNVILPRSSPTRLSGIVFTGLRLILQLLVPPSRPYAVRDRVMAFFAPIGLIALLVAWMTLVQAGFTAMFWAVGVESVRAAFVLSGSSLLTLGFAIPADLPGTILVFAEASIGLILVALLISYLPTIYSTFSRREVAVTLLETRAGSPPSAVEMIERVWRIAGRVEPLLELWESWEIWFAELEESHTSLAVLPFFRSPNPNRSWVTAAGAVLDAAALFISTLDVPRAPQPALCIRAGSLALRRIGDFFVIPYPTDPQPNDPANETTIQVTRAEFDAACARLAQAGLPLKPDRDQAWRDFAGWRINYDAPLIGLAELTVAPPAPWSSDRILQHWRPPFKRTPNAGQETMADRR